MKPSKKQLERWRQNGSDPEQRPKTFFKLAPVWDRSQVDELAPPAKVMPLDPPIAPLEGDSLAGHLPRLIAFAATIGSAVSFEAMRGEAHGYYEPASKRIAIGEDLSPNAQVKTLLHELAHALVRVPGEGEEKAPALSYAEEELVVESVALCVTSSVGFDASGYSIAYLCSWSQDTPIETIERTGTLIDRLATRLEDVLVQDDAAREGEVDERAA